MTSRWEVTKAVRASDLSAPSRLILLVLADVAEVGTAEIPPRFSPSLTLLERETGLGRSTIRRHLDALESAGWIVRTRPNGAAMRKGETVQYRLDVPISTADIACAQAEPTEGPQRTQPVSAVTTGYIQNGYPGVPTADTPIRSVPDLSDLGSSSSSATASRPDVDQICDYLADKIAANGSKRPKITREWRTQARLLLDSDGRTVEQVLRAIDWCQADTFWRANVLSMPTLRKQYDRLRLAAQRAGPPVQSTGTARAAAALEAGRAVQAMLDRGELTHDAAAGGSGFGRCRAP